MIALFYELLRPRNFAPISVIAAVALAGCVEPNYRNEVTSDGDGHVKVTHVARDPEPAPAPVVISPSVATAPPAPAATVTNPQAGAVDQRIDALEEQSRKLNEEITRLKLQKAAESK